jgi:hypothetical protein
MAEKQDNELSMGADEKVGSYLRRVREARGLNLEQLAKSIRLNKSILDAIEENRWNDFPTEAYLRSYIISMCEKLLLDKHAVIGRFSAEINSQFAIAQILAGESNQEGESSHNIGSKIAAVIILIIVIVMFFVLSGNSKKKPTPEAPARNIEKPVEVEDDASAEPDANSDSVVSSPQVAAASGRDFKARANDTLRFECSPAPTDNTCGASLKDFDTKMSYFTRTLIRQINHSDTAQVTITVPFRTRLLLNNARLDYGNFNTLYFHRGEIVRSFNRELK